MTFVTKDDNTEELREKYLAHSHLLGFDSLSIKQELELLLRRMIINLINRDYNKPLESELHTYFARAVSMFDRRSEIADFNVDISKDFATPFTLHLIVPFTYAKQNPLEPPENFKDNIKLSFDYY